MSVCPSISGHGARTAGPIGTGVAPMDAPKRRNDYGACRGLIAGTWHLARAAPLRTTKNFIAPLGVKRGQPLNPNSQVTRVLYQLKILWGCHLCRVPPARARDEEAVLT